MDSRNFPENENRKFRPIQLQYLNSRRNQNKFENYCKYIMIVMKINIYHQTIIMSHLCQSVQI